VATAIAVRVDVMLIAGTPIFSRSNTTDTKPALFRLGTFVSHVR
jgi:hypothetical protein